MVHHSDVIIIGAGPVGLFTIFQCGMMGLKCSVVESLDEIGGQCTALYPEKPIYDIPAHPKIAAADLIHQLEKQASPFSPRYFLGQQAVSLKKEDQSWKITTSSGENISAKAIIIAAGAGSFGPNKPPLPDRDQFENKSLFYHVRNPEFFRNKKVLIAGGGDSAIDWALNLQPLAEKITLVHRRPKFKAAPENVGKVYELASKDIISLAIPYQLKALNGLNGILKSVTLYDLEGNEKEIEADFLLSFFGLSMTLGPLLEWGLSLDKSHISVHPNTYETSLDGIFAVGDICTYPHKQKLILTGFSEAAQAAHQARSLVYPGESFHFEYSTTKGLPHS